MSRWFPLFQQLKGDYDLRRDLKGDLNAGLIVAIMLIPQGMAYAMLAGLPPVMGLYASTVPLFLYALFGTSRQLAVGPVAMVSLLVFTGVSGLAEPGSSEYISYVVLLAVMTGIIQLVMGLLRIGKVTKFISHAVISGFTSAAAIIIGLSQLKHLLGVDLGESKNVFVILYEALSQAGSVHLPTLAIGAAAIVSLVLLKKYVKKIPGPLAVVIISILFVWSAGLDEKGVSIVGEIPAGLPSFSIPAFDFGVLQTLLPIAVTISIIGFVESYAMAKVIAGKERYPISADQELRALGISNAGAGLFSGFPVTGGFSRSAVNYSAGARSGLATVITGIFIVLTLLFFTSWFYYLPQAVLAAIIFTAVYALIDFRELLHLWKIKRADAAAFIITFAATLVIGIEAGIAAGIVFSLLTFIYRSGSPHMARLGWVDRIGAYRNTERFPDAVTDPALLLVRIDAPVYFANMGYIEEQLRSFLLEEKEAEKVVFDFSGVNDMDAVAIDEMEKWIDDQEEQGISIYLTEVKGPVRDLLERAGWKKKYPHMFAAHTLDQTITSIHGELEGDA
ncbi:SulP family inorganic anion transporter [Alteribacter natronophilus]|uniref:SulP family inorganic anion transporter n=1 Tax=Alteribacter natronophilus TaxID=2583810 RepID=UPI00110EA37D|nr:solute carrier family 26 protein [Alteribacter natronophilus]TMW73001.1 solute carrier 26 family protein [Alteribacter natronophilus]